jgi:ribulose 1,5-bisphosphate synthetase/thiazole synthase
MNGFSLYRIVFAFLVLIVSILFRIKMAGQGEKTIVIVGAGLAGLSAGIESYRVAKDQKLQVRIVIIDKAQVGGNSAKVYYK